MDWIFPYPLTTTMGIEKHSSKAGFLQIFDWNAKSRKKLFSSEYGLPEQSKHKKRYDGNLPTTRLQMMEIDETTAGSSVKEGSDYSCSSSLMDEDFYGPRPLGVVARLMGLDSLPKSTPLFDSQSLQDNSIFYRRTGKPEYFQDQSTSSGSLHDLPVRNVIKKFQTEVLPPKSSKSIPITHHKLLSPIKTSNFTPSKDAARVMEAAARIIEPGRRLGGEKTKIPPVSSSSASAPLRVIDFKEKVYSARNPSKVFEGPQRKAESNTAKSVRGHSVSNYSTGKSISLALQAKANVQKREGLSTNSIRSPASPKQPCELSPNNNNNLFKSQPNTQKNTSTKPCYTQNGRNVLSQNNQKQNCTVDRGKSPNQCINPKSKFGGNSKVSMKKIGSEVKDDKSKVVPSSGSERITRKKRSVDGNFHSEKNQPVKNVKGSISWDHQDRGNMGTTDVVSFTFTTPMTRSGPADTPNNTKGGDALSALLEEKLKELDQKVVFSQQKSKSDFLHNRTDVLRSTVMEEDKDTDGMDIDSQGVQVELSMCGSNISQATESLDCRHPSPVSVLGLSPFAESCNSSDTADSNCMGDSKQCFSSLQAQELLDMYSSKLFLRNERREFSDSASSNLTNDGKSRKWELEYVKEILFNLESMFEDYAYSDRAQGVVNSLLFNQLESSKGYFSSFGETSRTDRRLIFYCVSECLDSRYGPYITGGYEQWAKGNSVIRRKERLVEEIWKEISGWSTIGDSVIDELVDKDMSSQYGKWLNFDIEGFELGIQIESRILNSLIDEVVADMLML